MIEKMKFISIVGPKHEIDRITQQYLSRYEIQLENSLAELKELKNIVPCSDSNPYRELKAKADELEAMLLKPDAGAAKASRRAAGTKEKTSTALVDEDKACSLIEELYQKKEQAKEERLKVEASYNKVNDLLTNILPFKDLHYDVASILHFKNIKFRFGKLPVDSYKKLQEYLSEDGSSIFDECGRDQLYVWGVYFVPVPEEERMDALYSSLHFERIFIDDDYQGTVEEACESLTDQRNELDVLMRAVDSAYLKELESRRTEFLPAAEFIGRASENFEVRRLAAFTRSKEDTFFILCGWMGVGDACKFMKEVEREPEVFCMLEDEKENHLRKPPTKLKNPGIFKPFEMYIRMYGLPNYEEFDPTIFVAITYSVIFGAMFGDVGQGICLFIGGLLLYKFKKLNLAAIISSCGIFSTLFGFLFGSFFGFEDVIEPLWLRPAEAMTNLPFIGNLNTVFVVSVALGMGMILLMMLFNIVNCLRRKELGEALFDTNGIAGFVFYAAAVMMVVLFMTGHKLPAAAVLAVMFIVPLLVIACKEPLAAKFLKKKHEEEAGGIGMFLVQAFFELFEVILSYFSNTISFVRIGAFAVSHACMMQVVMMLAGAENGGAPNWIVVILGNLIVCGMEGLIVGIQGLRLQYYEFFGRFYHGDGREFRPYSRVK